MSNKLLPMDGPKVNISSFFSHFPVLNLGDITLRAMKLEDAEDYFALMSDPRVNQYESDENVPTTLEEAMTEVRYYGGLFHRRQSVYWVIADSNTEKLIGIIGYNSWSVHNQRAEVSYDILPEYWRRGIGTKALNNIVAFGFTKMFLNRIEARTTIENVGSVKLLMKIGFKQDGILRSYRLIRGKFVDINMLSILRKNCALPIA